MKFDPQNVRERDFPQPEDEQVDDRRRPGVARTIERLSQYHAVGVEEEAVRNDAQAINAILRDVRIGCIEPNDLWRE